MKSVIFVAMLVACGTSDGPKSPFDREACDPAWKTSLLGYEPASCDRQCAPVPPQQSGSAASSGSGALCYASRPGLPNITCEHTFSDGYGLSGCCDVNAGSGAIDGTTGYPLMAHVDFYECQ